MANDAAAALAARFLELEEALAGDREGRFRNQVTASFQDEQDRMARMMRAGLSRSDFAGCTLLRQAFSDAELVVNRIWVGFHERGRA